MNLYGKRILLGVSGGIASYKSCELLRLFQKKGAEVRVCMTESATEFVSPLTFSSLSKCPVYLKNGAIESRPFQHIDFPHWADLYVVAPATANVIGKFVYGLADDPVSLCFMSCLCTRFIAPAMNVAMFNSPAVKRNLHTLKSFENTFVMDSPSGSLACGEIGNGRLLEPVQIIDYLESVDDNFDLKKENYSSSLKTSYAQKYLEETKFQDSLSQTKNKKNVYKVLITAGRTEEEIDPVRYISNRSSGKTAVAIASTFLANGFDVCVIAGPMEAHFASGIQVIKVKSACEMHRVLLEQMKSFDVIVHCAAVADYRPKHVSDKKIKDSRSELILELEPNPNILRDSVSCKRENQVIIGFALETDNFENYALEKLKKSGADAILLNAPFSSDSGFGFDDVRYTLVKKNTKIEELKLGSKLQLAQEIVDYSLNKLSAV